MQFFLLAKAWSAQTGKHTVQARADAVKPHRTL